MTIARIIPGTAPLASGTINAGDAKYTGSVPDRIAAALADANLVAAPFVWIPVWMQNIGFDPTALAAHPGVRLLQEGGDPIEAAITLPVGPTVAFDATLADTFRCTTAAAGSTLAGLVASTAGREVRFTVSANSGGPGLTLAHQSLSEPTAANRIVTGIGADITLSLNQSATLAYDAAAPGWRVVSLGF